MRHRARTRSCAGLCKPRLHGTERRERRTGVAPRAADGRARSCRLCLRRADPRRLAAPACGRQPAQRRVAQRNGRAAGSTPSRRAPSRSPQRQAGCGITVPIRSPWRYSGASPSTRRVAGAGVWPFAAAGCRFAHAAGSGSYRDPWVFGACFIVGGQTLLRGSRVSRVLGQSDDADGNLE